MDTFAERIRELRGRKTQDELAKELGIHTNTLGRWERGQSEPDITAARQICTKFGVSPYWLLDGYGSMLEKDRSGIQRHTAINASYDASVLYEVVKILEEYLEEDGSTLPPAAKAELVCQLYELVIDEEAAATKPVRIFRLIKGKLAANG